MKEKLFKSVPWHFSEQWSGCECSFAQKCVDTAISLQDLFIGAKIEGQGGFAKLYKAKEMYYEKLVETVQKEVESYNEHKEEVYGLLNEFLGQCVVPNSLWNMQKWLYYVKTDVVFQSMSIENNGLTFFFDASNVEYKKNNEKRNIVYELKKTKENKVVFLVYYKEGEIETDIKVIL